MPEIIKTFTSTASMPGAYLNHPDLVEYKNWVEQDLQKSVEDVEQFEVSMEYDQCEDPDNKGFFKMTRHDNKETWKATFKDGSEVTRVVEA